MNAAKENFLLKGYYNRKTKAAEKLKKDSLVIKVEEQKAIQQKAIEKYNGKKQKNGWI